MKFIPSYTTSAFSIFGGHVWVSRMWNRVCVTQHRVFNMGWVAQHAVCVCMCACVRACVCACARAHWTCPWEFTLKLATVKGRNSVICHFFSSYFPYTLVFSYTSNQKHHNQYFKSCAQSSKGTRENEFFWCQNKSAVVRRRRRLLFNNNNNNNNNNGTEVLYYAITRPKNANASRFTIAIKKTQKNNVHVSKHPS